MKSNEKRLYVPIMSGKQGEVVGSIAMIVRFGRSSDKLHSRAIEREKKIKLRRVKSKSRNDDSGAL